MGCGVGGCGSAFDAMPFGDVLKPMVARRQETPWFHLAGCWSQPHAVLSFDANFIPPRLQASAYTWGKFETHEQLKERMAGKATL